MSDVVPDSVTQCDECEKSSQEVDVTIHCSDCDNWFCSECDKKQHKKGKRQQHQRKTYVKKVASSEEAAPDNITKCDECEESRDDVGISSYCEECEQWLCGDCDRTNHSKGKRKTHTRKTYKTTVDTKGGSGHDESGPATELPSSVECCDECEESRNEVMIECYCAKCGQYLCAGCNAKMHAKGHRKNHVLQMFKPYELHAGGDDLPGPPPVDDDLPGPPPVHKPVVFGSVTDDLPPPSGSFSMGNSPLTNSSSDLFAQHPEASPDYQAYVGLPSYPTPPPARKPAPAAPPTPKARTKELEEKHDTTSSGSGSEIAKLHSEAVAAKKKAEDEEVVAGIKVPSAKMLKMLGMTKEEFVKKEIAKLQEAKAASEPAPKKGEESDDDLEDSGVDSDEEKLNDDEKDARATQVLTTGRVMWRYLAGKKVQKFVWWVNGKGGGVLYFSDSPKDKTEDINNSMSVNSITELYGGKQTPEFRKKPGKEADQEHSFSIVSGSNVWELETKTKREREALLRALRKVLNSQGSSFFFHVADLDIEEKRKKMDAKRKARIAMKRDRKKARWDVNRPAQTCDDCGKKKRRVEAGCEKCEQWLCLKCDHRIHSKGARSKHDRKYLSAQKSDALVQENSGTKHFEMKKFDKAVQDFSEAIRLDPENPRFYAKRAASFLAMKQFQEAIADASKCTDLKPDVGQAYLIKGRAFEALGQLEDAYEVYRAGNKMDKDNELLANALNSTKKTLKARGTLPKKEKGTLKGDLKERPRESLIPSSPSAPSAPTAPSAPSAPTAPTAPGADDDGGLGPRPPKRRDPPAAPMSPSRRGSGMDDHIMDIAPAPPSTWMKPPPAHHRGKSMAPPPPSAPIPDHPMSPGGNPMPPEDEEEEPKPAGGGGGGGNDFMAALQARMASRANKAAGGGGASSAMSPPKRTASATSEEPVLPGAPRPPAFVTAAANRPPAREAAMSADTGLRAASPARGMASSTAAPSGPIGSAGLDRAKSPARTETSALKSPPKVVNPATTPPPSLEDAQRGLIKSPQRVASALASSGVLGSGGGGSLGGSGPKVTFGGGAAQNSGSTAADLARAAAVTSPPKSTPTPAVTTAPKTETRENIKTPAKQQSPAITPTPTPAVDPRPIKIPGTLLSYPNVGQASAPTPATKPIDAPRPAAKNSPDSQKASAVANLFKPGMLTSDDEDVPPPPSTSSASTSVPLPKGPEPAQDTVWTALSDPRSGRTYWGNKLTGQTTWEDPYAPKKSTPAAAPAAPSSSASSTPPAASSAASDSSADPFTEHTDPKTGKKYWYNATTKSTTWVDPHVNSAGASSAPPEPKILVIHNPDWKEYKDPGSGQFYYMHATTKQTTWTNPHQWNEWVDKGTSRKYWHNETTNKTTWVKPQAGVPVA